MTHLSTLQITLQHQRDNAWPVSAVLKSSQPDQAPRWQYAQLAFPTEDWETQLLKWTLAPDKYGQLLGKALFHSGLDQLLRDAIAGYERTHLFLVIEAPELKSLRWERLHYPDHTGDWVALAQNQNVPFSYYTATLTTRYYPSLLQRDLRALLYVCSPPQNHSGNTQFDWFDTAELAASIQSEAGKLPVDALYTPEETSWEHLLDRLNRAPYPTILHIVCHGYYDDKETNENYLVLLNDKQQVQTVSARRFVNELKLISPLPHLIIFSSCQTAHPSAQSNIHGHFALQVRSKLDTPAVIAMSDTVTQATANTLSREFYPFLYEQAYVDLALAKAGRELWQRRDRYLPVLFQRLGNTPLFGFEPKRLYELDNKEIGDGLERLAELLPVRAPTAEEAFKALAARVRAHQDNALEDADQFCHEVAEIGFAALAQDDSGELLSAYNAECPFPGMRPFRMDTDDGLDYRKYFFGRQQETDELIEQLKQKNIVAIVGPSGSGKSSLVFAGVLPALQKQNPELQIPGNSDPGMRPICRMEQGKKTTPLQTLRQLVADTDPAKPALIFIDQFEEVFTTCGAAERKEFLQTLVALPKQYPLLKVLFTIRADFSDEYAYREALLKPIIDKKYYLDLMKTDALRAAMEQQAESTGLKFEVGLAHRIISEAVNDERGVMPLLQHLLWLLWQQRRGRYLLTSAYSDIGGVSQAIASTADALFKKYKPYVDEAGQQHHKLTRLYLKNIFLRLTRPDTQRMEGVDREYRDTRQRVPKSSLYPKDVETKLIDLLIKELADARLIVTYESEVEISHESLITHWHTLKNWLENRQLIGMQQELGEDAQNWNQARQAGGKRSNDLLRHSGSQIDAIETEQNNRSLFLNTVEEDYLTACRRRDQRVERNRKNVKRFGAVMAVLFMIATVVSVLAVYQKNKADDRLAEQYFQQGIELRDDQTQGWDKAEKYFAKALDVVADKRLRANMQFAYADVQRFAPKLKATMQHKKRVLGIQLFAVDNRVLTWSEDGTARIWDANTGEPLTQPMRHDGKVTRAMMFAADNRVLTWSEDGTAQIWDANTGEPLTQPMRHDDSIGGGN